MIYHLMQSANVIFFETEILIFSPWLITYVVDNQSLVMLKTGRV